MIMRFFFALILATLFNTQLDATISIQNTTGTPLTVQFNNYYPYQQIIQHNEIFITLELGCIRHLRVSLQVSNKQPKTFLLSKGTYVFQSASQYQGFKLTTVNGEIYTPSEECSLLESCCADYFYCLLECCHNNPCFPPHTYTEITDLETSQDLEEHKEVRLWEND